MITLEEKNIQEDYEEIYRFWKKMKDICCEYNDFLELKFQIKCNEVGIRKKVAKKINHFINHEVFSAYFDYYELQEKLLSEFTDDTYDDIAKLICGFEKKIQRFGKKYLRTFLTKN